MDSSTGTGSLPAYFQNRPPGSVIIHSIPKLDLETYIDQYSGHVKIVRLYEIARSSPFLSVDALHLMIQTCRKSGFVRGYTKAVTLLQDIEPTDPLAKLDSEWVHQQTAADKTEISRLQSEIRGYQTNLVKESIRLGILDLASQHYRIGNIHEAAEGYKAAIDYCQTFRQRFEIYNELLLAYIASESWDQVESTLKKMVRNETYTSEDMRRVTCTTSLLLGMVHLQRRNFAKASSLFVSVSDGFLQYTSDKGHGIFPKLPMSPIDLGVYATLTTLAAKTLDYSIQTDGLANVQIYTSLDPNLSKLLNLSEQMAFGPCLDLLYSSFRDNLLLDPYIQPHADALLQAIRQNFIRRYAQSFSTIRLTTLEKTFPIRHSNRSAEDDVLDLIKEAQHGYRYNKVDQYIERPIDAGIFLRARLQEKLLKDTELHDPATVRTNLFRSYMLATDHELPDLWELRGERITALRIALAEVPAPTSSSRNNNTTNTNDTTTDNDNNEPTTGQGEGGTMAESSAETVVNTLVSEQQRPPTQKSLDKRPKIQPRPDLNEDEREIWTMLERAMKDTNEGVEDRIIGWHNLDKFEILEDEIAVAGGGGGEQGDGSTREQIVAHPGSSGDQMDLN